ncbi:AAA family ATPase [Arenimonas oryziterrae]|nr:AAA family ATPase [Arenimonas oryziterrae]
MLKQLRLENFRAFRQVTIDFSRITILAGANSSGKSSILQAINGVLQSKSERGFPFDFVLNGQLTQLGSYRNVVHGHNAKHSFGIHIKFSLGGEEYSAGGTFKVADDSPNLFPRSISCSTGKSGSISIEWNQKDRKFKLKIDPTQSLLAGNSKRLIDTLIELAKVNRPSDQKSVAQLVSAIREDSGPATGMLVDLLSESVEIGREGIKSSSADAGLSLSEFEGRPFFVPIRNQVYKALDVLRGQSSYLGPVRAHPSRYYSVARQNFTADPYGESMSHTLALWKENRNPRFVEVKQALVNLELATDLNAELELGEFLKLLVKPKGRQFPDTIADVGFGVSQVLPMLVADAALEDGGMLMVNQPEIHLHPSSQALLGNYFSSRSKKRQYVVETHSEYLINRLRLLVARNELQESDVVIYYCGSETTQNPSGVSKVTMKRDGTLSGMPKEFFSTYSVDTFNLAMTVMGDDDHASE